MSEQYKEDCLSCQSIQGLIKLTNTPRILRTRHWVVEHAGSASIKGWIIVVIDRHCTAIHDLTEEEMVEFGKLTWIISQALYNTMKTEKEYVIQLSEGKGFAHLHVHIIARLPEWPDELRGIRVMRAMGESTEDGLDAEEVTPLALEIREYLLKNLPAEMIVE